MSTVFEVWPRVIQEPKSDIVLKQIKDIFTERCYGMEIFNVPEVMLDLHVSDSNNLTKLPMKPDDDFSCSQGYLWMYLEGHSGGIDIIFKENGENEIAYFKKEIVPKHNDAWPIPALQDCLKPNFHWKFRRSTGQPGAINILYAIAAGCLAEVTNGAIFSSDGAWDYDQLPMTGSDAIKNLMRTYTTDEHSDWVLRCEKHMYNELGS